LGTVSNTIGLSRSFYGVLRVMEFNAEDPSNRQIAMVHGRITHGLQFCDYEKKLEPTAYFHRGSGIGQTIERLRGAKCDDAVATLRVGVIGLGVGTLAAYGEEGDYFRFYEINPDVVRLAKEHFTFLSQSKAEVELVLGDARLSLQQEVNQKFELLVVDAFSGDAIPTHLLTAEAIKVYQPHLADNGVLAVHFSNTHLNLEPVILGLAKSADMHALAIKTEEAPEMAARAAHWAVLVKDQASIGRPTEAPWGKPMACEPIIWTDDRCNLFEILR